MTEFFQNIAGMPIWEYAALGNTLRDYMIALFVFAIFLVVFKIFQVVILGRLQKLAERTPTDIDNTLVEIIRSLRPPFYSFLAFYFAAQFLTVADVLQRIINAILIIWVVFQAIHAVQLLINYVLSKIMRDEDAAPERTASMRSFLGLLAKGTLWVVGMLFILSNLGVNVTSVVAGLGIGGLAIALALQNILSDLFSSFAIYFDKPFQVGDFIVIGEKRGTVEKIGIKTTRIRSLSGEELVISNKELTTAQIHNFKKMQERRATFTFGVTYDTPVEKLKKISDVVQSILEESDITRVDRVHFKEFGDSALVFEIVYFMLVPEYGKFMDTQQHVNIRILEEFEKMGVSMAFPTRTLYIEKGDNNNSII